MNNYFDDEIKKEAEEVSAARAYLIERLRYLKAAVWDLEQVLHKGNSQPAKSDLQFRSELISEIQRLIICDETLERVGQGVDFLVKSADRRAKEIISDLNKAPTI